MNPLQKFYGEAQQDKFVVRMLKGKNCGFFVEIGSFDPIYANNTYILEKNYNWKGLMIEHDEKWLSDYQLHRPDSIHIMQDATEIDYEKLFADKGVPFDFDYLQVDLEVNDGSTLKTLKKLNDEVFDKYKSATITFEHDVYRVEDEHKEVYAVSRAIFGSRGYIRVFENIQNSKYPNIIWEDWYVHPDLVDIDYVAYLMRNNAKNYIHNEITTKSIISSSIEY